MKRYGFPAKIGFLLGRTGTRIPWLENREYRGIDRLPFVPSPLDMVDDSGGDAWSQYLTAWEDGQLGANFQVAEEARARLVEVGQDLEIIYADIVKVPREEELKLGDSVVSQRDRSLSWLASRPETEASPRQFVSIGFDISTPIPSFHSLIMQPGLVRQDAGFASCLNAFGLISEDEPQYAIQLMDEANATGYMLSMFCVIRVSISAAGSTEQ